MNEWQNKFLDRLKSEWEEKQELSLTPPTMTPLVTDLPVCVFRHLQYQMMKISSSRRKTPKTENEITAAATGRVEGVDITLSISGWRDSTEVISSLPGVVVMWSNIVELPVIRISSIIALFCIRHAWYPEFKKKVLTYTKWRHHTSKIFSLYPDVLTFLVKKTRKKTRIWLLLFNYPAQYYCWFLLNPPIMQKVPFFDQTTFIAPILLHKTIKTFVIQFQKQICTPWTDANHQKI